MKLIKRVIRFGQACLACGVQPCNGSTDSCPNYSK